MQIENLVPKILYLFFKLIVGVIIFFVILNIFCYLYNKPRLDYLAKLVQDSVRKHGYMPYQDYKTIKTIIDRYTYQAKNEESPLNINKVITNLNIVVYDLDKKGYPTTSQLHSYMTDDDYNGAYIDVHNSEYIKENKKQQGACLFAGISCDYLILHPLNGWMLFDTIVDTKNNTEITTDVIEDMVQPFEEVTPPTDIIYGDNEASRPFGYTTINTLEMFNQNDTDEHVSSAFVECVITEQFYPDKPDSLGY